MISADDLVVLAMIAIAVGFVARRIWRRVRPPAGAATGGGCAGCGGCDTNPSQPRRCNQPTDGPHD